MTANELIEQMADIFALATTGFEEFQKSAPNSSSGNYSKSASSGDSSQSASSGNYSQSASSGNYSKSASSGNYSQSASSGYYSKSASSGYYSQSASSGYYSKSASSGYYSACSALGYRAAVKGDLGNLLMASEYARVDGKVIPVGGKADLVDGKALKPQQWYIVERGKWVAVDFTDGVFTYLISTRNGVKKVRNEDGTVLYIVSDDQGNSAHGATIKEAREDLIYKVVAKFDGKLPESASGTEWIGIYRAVTGACAAGVRGFVESQKVDLSKTYSGSQIADMVRGQYGAEAFAKKLAEVGR